MKKPPIFLVSTGRTGTQFLSRFFATYGSDVVSYHCPSGTRLIHVFANIYEQGLISKNVMASIWRGLRASMIESHIARYVECNPYYYNLCDIITSCFPNANFVHIIRSPRTYIISHINWERYQWKSTLATRMIPFWQPTSFLNQLKGFLNNYHQRVEFYSQLWTRKNSAILRSECSQKKIRTLRYEDIFDLDNGVKVLTDLMDWLEIPFCKSLDPNIITKRENASRKVWDRTWDERCSKIVQRHCGQLMQAYDYTL